MKFTLDHILQLPRVLIPRLRGGRAANDAWQGIARDVIERFVDVQCVQFGIGRSGRAAYRQDLRALDEWMARTAGRTLITAGAEDLRRYFSDCASAGLPVPMLLRSLSSMSSFYRFLREGGCRRDDPVEQLMVDLQVRRQSFVAACTTA